ncbi:thioesterase II family protein [Bradyrhizobium prioriisuperbiae]|uniref:thioesterase II family protein n=1 Tax=Bradyrhizobium prioriisuperbiae TaxID=2854389 RepID=UPI0028EA8507|nr:alpha/beta fold hydrolase [Bradyrhizobium prioritasuperba]
MTHASRAKTYSFGRDRGELLRLYCFPFAGGSGQFYEPWRNRLPSAIAVIPIEIAGRGRRLGENLVVEFESHVDEIVTDLTSDDPVPFAFFGHSMGALLAFEVARRLRNLGQPGPLRLFVSAHRAPHLPDREADLYQASDAVLVEQLRTWSGTPERILSDASMQRIILPILRADLATSASYRFQPGPPLECPIIAFGAWSDPEASQEELAAWSEQTSARFQLEMFSGAHFFIRDREDEFMPKFRDELSLFASEVLMQSVA